MILLKLQPDDNKIYPYRMFEKTYDNDVILDMQFVFDMLDKHKELLEQKIKDDNFKNEFDKKSTNNTLKKIENTQKNLEDFIFYIGAAKQQVTC